MNILYKVIENHLVLNGLLVILFHALYRPFLLPVLCHSQHISQFALIG